MSQKITKNTFSPCQYSSCTQHKQHTCIPIASLYDRTINHEQVQIYLSQSCKVTMQIFIVNHNYNSGNKFDGSLKADRLSCGFWGSQRTPACALTNSSLDIFR